MRNALCEVENLVMRVTILETIVIIIIISSSSSSSSSIEIMKNLAECYPLGFMK